jgi:hypothetical protein
MRPSLEDVFVRITGIETGSMRKEKEKAGGTAMKQLDRLLEHRGQGYADLLPEAAQHQLGAHLSPGLDRHVFHQIRHGARRVFCLLPGVVALSILFGTTSMLAVTVTFEKKNRSFERLLLAPVPLELLMLAKTGGAILFGVPTPWCR